MQCCIFGLIRVALIAKERLSTISLMQSMKVFERYRKRGSQKTSNICCPEYLSYFKTIRWRTTMRQWNRYSKRGQKAALYTDISRCSNFELLDQLLEDKVGRDRGCQARHRRVEQRTRLGRTVFVQRARELDCCEHRHLDSNSTVSGHITKIENNDSIRIQITSQAT